MILREDRFREMVEGFNRADHEDVVNLVPNAGAWEWIRANAPMFECPDRVIEEIYYYRWWTFRKHIRQTPAGRVMTEFITPVRHAGAYNTISCALGHHLAEGRWLRDQGWLDEYVRFWFRGGEGGGAQPHFHQYSQWVGAAILDRARVTGDMRFAVDLLPDLVADYRKWEGERGLADGMFWQFDVRDGMEESISGSRKERNRRPTINSYMCGNAAAIARIATAAGDTKTAEEFHEKAESLRKRVRERLWDPDAQFFKVVKEDGAFSDAREEIGFIPWCFGIAGGAQDVAWKQLVDPAGFWAPFGITTAERRHPKFRSHGVGKCEWDGAVWPFATSQTLGGMAKVIRAGRQGFVTREHYLEAVETYARSQHRGGQPCVGEYLDETDGRWLTGENPRSRYYNHSTFCDLVISGLVGVVPREEGDVVDVDPLVPAGAWDWFCLEGVAYRGRNVTVLWDRDGRRYGVGVGLRVVVDGKEVARSGSLTSVSGRVAA